MFLAAVLLVGFLAGVTAAVSGFGIGSLLTPLLAVRYGTAVAVAAVALPHALATAVRFVRLRSSIDRAVLVRFGALSAIGGLAGALGYARLGSRALTIVLGVLLVMTALATLAGLSQRWHPRGPIVGLLGLASGFFGGIAGNQGGLRAAALMSFPLTPAQFVATSTAIALVVDAVRTPVYLLRAGPALADLWPPILAASIGVYAGTLAGERMLFGMRPETFRRMVAVLIGAIGVVMLIGSR